jgi:hypothetical protein
MSRLGLVWPVLCLALAFSGCDSGDDDGGADQSARGNGATVTAPKGIAGTTKVEESGEPAAKATERNLGREISPGQSVVIGARCEDGRCVVRYRSVPRGTGAVLEKQSRIFRRLFADQGVRSVVIYVHHQFTGQADKNEAPAFAVTKCRRGDRPTFAWARIRASDIQQVCSFTHVAGGKQRSLVRRGLLSSKKASLGKGEPPGHAKESGGPPGKGGGPPDK